MRRKEPVLPKTLDPASYAAGHDSSLSIEGIDYVELLAGNARLTANFFMTALGFRAIAYRGPETGYRDEASYVLEQGKIRFVITSPLLVSNPLGFSLLVHGDTISDVALRVRDCEGFYAEAVRRGARSAEEPRLWEDSNGRLKRAGLQLYGQVRHSIIQRNEYQGRFAPGFEPYESYFALPTNIPDVGLAAVDHVVGNVPLGEMQKWVSFYERVLGFEEFKHFTDKDISTEYSALMSKVVADGTGKIKFPINEPAVGKRKSQIDEYLDFHVGPGVQHVALITGDIIGAVRALRERGVNFLTVPRQYYADLQSRVGEIKESVEQIAELGILVDRDEEGYLLQIFTKPIHDRPTLFFEIIQRRGSRGFGVGNFKALFEAIEREQALRGNL